MRKRKYLSCTSKILNIVGLVSVGSLALVMLAALIPTISMSSFAVSKDDDITANVNTSVAALVRSSISVAVTNRVNLDLTPSSQGTFSTGVAKLDVTTNNTTGYAVYLRTKDDSSALQPAQSGVTETIGEPTGTISNNNYKDNLNTWGYAVAKNSSDTDLFYQAIPKSTDTAIIKTDETDQEDSYDLSFGVAIGPSLPSGIYTNELIVSVVANPIEVRSLTDLTFMQEMTPEVCKISYENETKQLIDSRDSKKYWVAKLADGNCWMVQNLDLDLNENTLPLTNQTTDLTSIAEWSPSFNTTNIIPATYPEDGQDHSFDMGDYVWVAISNTTLCNHADYKTCDYWQNVANWQPTFVTQNGIWGDYEGLVAAQASDPASPSAGGKYDAHYLVGNIYQWDTAAAGGSIHYVTTANGISQNPVANNSVCPKGWTLPSSQYVTSDGDNKWKPADTPKSFYNLVRSYGGPIWSDYLVNSNGAPYFKTTNYSSDNLQLITPPDYYVSFSALFRSETAKGNTFYWGNTPGGAMLRTASGPTIYPAVRYYQKDAFFVRCIAK